MLLPSMCLALAIYWESRSEPVMGQIAVAHVILNRVESSKYPDNVCDVVTDHKQFSFYWDGKSDRPKDVMAWDKAQTFAKIARDLADTTKGSTHYHTDYVEPFWARGEKPLLTIGSHIFYRL